MILRWPHPLQSELAIGSTLSAYDKPLFPAGVVHFYEHLLFRQLKRAVETLAPNQAILCNGRTQVDHFYLYMAFRKGGGQREGARVERQEIMDMALGDPEFRIGPEEFCQEKNVVIREIEERGTLNERLLARIQDRYLRISPDHQGLLGHATAIAALDYEAAMAELNAFIPRIQRVTCQAARMKSRQDLPTASWNRVRNQERNECLHLRFDVESFAIGQRLATVCVLEMENPSLWDLLRVQALEQILRHLPGPGNLNSWIRETFGASYGFHGLQLSQGKRYLFTWTAFSAETPPSELLDLLRARFQECPALLAMYGTQAVARLLLEDVAYRHPLGLIHKIPELVLRFGPETQMILDHREQLLVESLPVSLVVTPLPRQEVPRVRPS